MERFIDWTNTVASWFVDLPVGWQMFFALLILIPICLVIAKFLLLPIIDAVQNAYRRRVDVHNVIEPAVVENVDERATTAAGVAADGTAHSDSR